MSGVDPARARGFDAWAGDYDRYRPTYPDELFDVIAQRLPIPRQPHVVDLGAGTGRASLAMAERGWRVTAVEPGKPMLDQLRGRAANQGLLISTVQATAEETGLDLASADLVTAAQAFHWFDKDRALGEAARILKPSGGLALFWNVRDAERSPFLADYGELLRDITDDDAGRYESGLAEATGLPDETRKAIEAHAVAFEEPAADPAAARADHDRRRVHRHGLYRLVRAGWQDPRGAGSLPARPGGAAGAPRPERRPPVFRSLPP